MIRGALLALAPCMTNSNPRITQLIQSGTPESAEELLPLVYDQLRSLAAARMAGEKPGQTLQATALVHEAFLRVAGGADQSWDGRRHFFGAASEAMRRILVEQARRKGRVRHGGDANRVEIDHAEPMIEPPSDEILSVHEALDALDPKAREIVNLRYFTGMSNQETADALGVSESTIEREWRFIRTFLQGALRSGEQE